MGWDSVRAPRRFAAKERGRIVRGAKIHQRHPINCCDGSEAECKDSENALVEVTWLEKSSACGSRLSRSRAG